MLRSLVALALAASAASAAAEPFKRPPAAKGYSYPECYCTNRGERVELGRLSCIRIGSSAYTARCDMSQNNPTWRRVEDGCDAEGGLSLAPPAPPGLSEPVEPG